MQIDLKSLTYTELENFLKDNFNFPKYKANQVYKWLYRGVTTFDEMTDISKKDRENLKEKAYINILEIQRKLVSKIDGTTKYLFKLSDGEYVESVVMRYKHGNSICISTQVGCKMRCDFCASALNGFIRNLTSSEIIDQIIFAQKDLGEKISNVVLMGMGEPLDNMENVLKFLENIHHPEGLCISHRHISLSTCGLVDKIDMLSDMDMQLTLSVSLHAPNDEIRNKIMPISLKYPYEDLMKSCKNYFNKTKRRISLEYILIDDLNDSKECAKMLSDRLRGFSCHVNLIPANSVKEKPHQKSPMQKVMEFQAELKRNNINATVRRTLGSDINASCGQLRNKEKQN
ncbi:MAG: 23S rRNA (adenine(2503)-C(2))-methyltransferase RlmN [Clostridia bacterium]|nr:23S rRNA (adenine(2503)-C(2))-methyltransferase RlmN [Clostridia bacterium]